MKLSIKVDDTDITFNYKGINNSNPDMPFLVFQTDVTSFNAPPDHDPTNEKKNEELTVGVCQAIADAIYNYLGAHDFSVKQLFQWNREVKVAVFDPVTKLPAQFYIYFPKTMQQELERVLAPTASLMEPVAVPQPPATRQPSASLAVKYDSQHSSLVPGSSAPRTTRLRTQDPLLLQNPDLFNGIKYFEELFNKTVTIEGNGDDRRYGRNKDNGIDITNNTLISEFLKQHLVANIKSLIPDPKTLTTPGKKTNKIPSFPKYAVALEQAIKEVWDSLMDKLVVVEELRLELVEKRKGLAAADQNEEIIKLTQKMQSKENEIIFIIEAYKRMFDALKQADGGPQDKVYEAKFKAIEDCQEFLVKLGWKGRLFISFCTLLGVVIGAVAGFLLGANGGIIAGAAAGSVLFPVPIVGTVKGALVGGTVTGVWAAIKAGGIGGAIGSGVGAFLMGVGSFGWSWHTANRTYSMDRANLHFFSACNKLVKQAQWFEEPTPDPRAVTLARMNGAS